MYKKIKSFLVISLILIIVLINIFFLWMLKNPDYRLKVKDDNQDKVIELLQKADKNIDIKKQIEKIEIKQGLGDVYVYVHYQGESEIYRTLVGDHEEIEEYIRKEGRDVNFLFEIILELLVKSIPINIFLMISNEVYYRLKKK